ncbi:hypothetical protein Adt_19542 [Abeliophyllum distichum]|uniref:Uncharacterized protein n=1 Tax=Abeliophyllum distichum TaxID=126358 RepID=A0ABD1ST87_9LAMI
MSHTVSQSPTKTRHKTTSLQPLQKTPFKYDTIGLAIPEKMATKCKPVEIGTRGTVGSLIMQEIEYFNQLEAGCRNSSNKPNRQVMDSASSSEFSGPKLGSVVTVLKKKKRGSNRLIPNMCSMVEVAESNWPSQFSSFTYRSLKTDLKRLQI